MRTITGFEKAREVLSRRVSAGAETGEHEQTVRRIIADVRSRGDAALIDYTAKFDGVKLSALEVDRAQVDAALRHVDAALVSALEMAARRIRAFHAEQKKLLFQERTGAHLGWLVRPLRRVGVHTPGFQAPLPSSLLMTAIPARVAGVPEVILVTPPQRNGNVSPVMLAAAAIAGVDRIFSVGGAQAVAALAYGTGSVPAVDKVCGPGNIYVTLAKKLLYGTVGIDGLYGPSEVIIIADESANPGYLAADLLAQAEHGSLAAAILITPSLELAARVQNEINRQLATISRKEVAAGSLEGQGFLVIVKSVDEAIALANLYAPEHLCLVIKNAADCIGKIENAGCLFIGEHSIEALVDYAAGPSHVLPTGGTARFGSPLNVTDFMKIISLVDLDRRDVRRLAPSVSVIARAEGLDAHARAVERRLENHSREAIE